MNSSARMGSAPVGSLLFEFALPATASMLVSALYSLADRIFIGQGTGVSGIAAATAAFPFMIVGMAVGLLFAVGARTVASVSLGEGNHGKAVQALSLGSVAAFIATAAVSILTWIFARPLLGLFGASPSISEDARIFLGIILLGLPFQAAAMTMASALQAQGRPRAAFVVNLIGTALNMILDPLFIFAFHWGLAGAAAATAISQVIGLLVVIAVVQQPANSLRIDVKALAPRDKLSAVTSGAGRAGQVVIEMVGIGLPLFLVNLVSTAILVVANNAVRPYGGDLGLAVIGVVNTVGMVLSYPLYGITNGSQALFGYNYGAKKWKRLQRLSILVALWTFGLALLAEAVSVLAPSALIRLFNGDPELLAMGSRALKIFMLAFALFPLSQLPATFFQSTGKPLPAGILMLARSAIMIASMVLLPRYFGLDGVYLAGPVSDVSAAIIGCLLLFPMVRDMRRGARAGERELGREEVGESPNLSLSSSSEAC